MQKSEIYRRAQGMVINATHIPAEIRVEVMKQLIHDEELALFSESLKEKELEAKDGEL